MASLPGYRQRLAFQALASMWWKTALAVLAFSLLVQTVPAATYTVHPSQGDFRSIQAAIEYASSGDTILVESGTYRENLKVDRRLTLKGVNTGGGSPVVDAGRQNSAIILLADGCRVEGFVISGGGAFNGISVSSQGNSLLSNTISGFGQGIALEASSRNTITGNTLSGNSIAGISLLQSSGNQISQNTVYDNSGYGLILGTESSGNRIYLNSFKNTKNAITSSISDWSSGGMVTYQYGNRALSSPLGNYWGDYSGNDGNNDGIGDDPYTIERGKDGVPKLLVPQNRRDQYPLIQPWEIYLGSKGGEGPTPVPTTGSESGGSATITPATQTPAGDTPFIPQEGSARPVAAVSLLYLGILGVAALLLSPVFFRDGRIAPRYQILERWPPGRLLAAGFGITGFALLILPFVTLSSILARPIGAVEFGIGIIVSLFFAYIALSALALAYGTVFHQPLITTARIHLGVSLIAAAALAFLALNPAGEGETFYPLSTGILLFSALLSFWQRERTQALVEASGRSTEAGVAASTLPSGLTLVNTLPSGDQNIPKFQNGGYFPPDLQGKYSSVEYIGKGGIARVFRARRVSDGRDVAVKIPISYDELTGISFLKEIKAWEELHHENIVELLEANILPIPYFEMEYLPRTLETIQKPMDVRQAARIVYEVAEGLGYAHAMGVIHRDLKPHNILLTPEGKPKIADWGLSKVAADSRASTLTGFSLPYAAPEQIAPKEYGKTDTRTDIYQLGMLFYELVTGRLPFQGDGIADIASSILHDRPVAPSRHNAEAEGVEAIILKCLEKVPSQRYQSAEEFQRDLEAYLAEPSNA